MSQPADSSGRHPKLFNDPIHGFITVDPTCLSMVDTEEFQRLRNLKQLGTTYRVFPGASHNRFEHCIGTSHLAGTMVERFRAKQPELEISERDVRIARLAGLCHDLGHGPFSHAFQYVADYIAPGQFVHEDMSATLIDHVVDRYDLQDDLQLEESDLEMVKLLIQGEERPRFQDRRFMFDIISNSRNGIDVDKWDYLKRDSYNVGLGNGFDIRRLIEMSRVIDNEVCYYVNEPHNLYEMFHTRARMHKAVYQHKAAKALEYMVGDALIAAAEDLKLKESLDDPHQFSQLTDSVIERIQWMDPSTSGKIRDAQDILYNMNTRRLYKCVGEVILPPGHQKPTPLDISSRQNSNGIVDLRPEDIIVNNYSISYSMKNKNPVDSVHFFTSWASKDKVKIDRSKVSTLLPDKFTESYVRVFVRSCERSKFSAAKVAFHNYYKSNGIRSPVPSAAAQSVMADHAARQNANPDLLDALGLNGPPDLRKEAPSGRVEPTILFPSAKRAKASHNSTAADDASDEL